MQFEGVKALTEVDLELKRGEILGLIGPNGSGKTTCLNALSGFVATEGEITMDGVAIGSWTPQRRVRAGLARTFQAVRLFRDLTVAENIEAAALGAGRGRRQARRTTAEILQRMDLIRLADLSADSLPAGEERRVGIARAAACAPRFLLLDEPAAGLNESESAGLVEVVQSFSSDYDCGVLLVEHDMDVIMGSCSRIQVLDAGRTISHGTPDEVSRDQAVITAYFGRAA